MMMVRVPEMIYCARVPVKLPDRRCICAYLYSKLAVVSMYSKSNYPTDTRSAVCSKVGL